ncbi:uridine kinase [Glycocaulis sp.]|uniref:uridine kinase n=1 Tax=Glycocaulis sp. TaxID=1969725 RepID=UPI003D232BB8
MARLIVGVSGGSASGKTEIARAAARAIAPLSALVMAEDDYYGDHGASPDFDAARFNFDHPASRDHALLADHLDALRRGESVDAPIYDFTIHRRRADTRRIAPCDIIFVEGIHLFCDARLKELFDIRVYVDAPDDIRLARRLLRDVNERGRTAQSVVGQYLGTVRPMHHEWTHPNADCAHIVIRNDAAAARPADHLEAFFDALAKPVVEAIRAKAG